MAAKPTIFSLYLFTYSANLLLTLSLDPGPGTLAARLVMSIPHGPNVEHTLSLSDGTELKAVERRDRAITPAPNQTQLFVSLDVTKLHAFPANEEEVEPNP